MNTVFHSLTRAQLSGAVCLPLAAPIAAAPSPTSPTTGTLEPIQLHADAHNALNMAVFFLRQPRAKTAAARRKAIQALAALRGLSLALEG